MTNGTASETNGITRGTNGDSPLSCPFCGCGMKAEVYQYNHVWYRVVPTENHAEGCFLREVQHRRFRSKEAAIASWNTRVAVTDHDFAMAVHDGRTWVCAEAAMESDALKPIPGFTRDSIYVDSMREYGEWVRKATELMRDIWTTTTWEYGMTDEYRDELRKRLEEFGIEVDE